MTSTIQPHRGQERAVALLLEQGAGLDHLTWELLHQIMRAIVQQFPTAVIPAPWTRGNVPAALTQPQNRPLHVTFMATAPQDLDPELDFEGEEARIMEATARPAAPECGGERQFA